MTDYFWNQPASRGRRQVLNPRPNVPVTNWKRPTSFPDLSGAGCISFDVETYDPGLFDRGEGWGRGEGHIVGLAIATNDGFCGYYPVRHEEDRHHNFDPQQVFDWARVQLTRPHQWKVAHRSIYDQGWLREENIIVKGPVWDTHSAEKLLNFRQSATLEDTGMRRVGRGKQSATLLRWLHAYHGRGKAPKEDEDLDDAIKGLIHKSPPSLAGPYGEEDVLLPIDVAAVQEKLLEDAGLMPVFRLECDLIPLLVQIRFEGVRVDRQRAEEADALVTVEMADLQREIDSLAGESVIITENIQIGRILTARGHRLPLTTKTRQVSVTNEVLKKIEDPLAERIMELKELDKFRQSFIRGAILETATKGRIHCTLKPFGTVTGRLSAENPNLQQIPSKNPKLMTRVRSIFIPEDGQQWQKVDYSQLQCRILAHYAVGRGADELRAEYNANPDTNYHKLTHQMIMDTTGVDLAYKQVKNTNFAGIFGAGENKIARMVGLSKQEAAPFFEAYHSGLPYVRDTMDAISRATEEKGYTQTILGRRALFDRYEPRYGQFDNERISLPLKEAVLKWGSNIKRAGLHRATNYIIQGSEGDLLKAALVQCWKDGIFDAVGVPKLLVHDEIDSVIPDDSPSTREAFREMHRIMQTAVKFSVPILAGVERGANWGTLEDFEL